MAEQIKLAEAFVRFFGDTADIERTAVEVPGRMAEAGAKGGRAYASSFSAEVAKAQTSLAQLVAQGEAGMQPKTSPFSTAGRAGSAEAAATTAKWRALIEGAGGGGASKIDAASASMGRFGKETEGAYASLRETSSAVDIFAGNILGSVNPVLGALSTTLTGSIRALRSLGIAFTAAGTVAAVAAVGVGLYFARIKEANDAQVRLGTAVFKSDYAGAATEVDTITNSIAKLNVLARIAGQEFKYFGQSEADTEKQSESISAFWEMKMSPSLRTLTKELQAAQTATDKLFLSFEKPKAIQLGIVEDKTILATQIANERAAAGTTTALAAAADHLTAAKRRQAEASAQAILTEHTALDLLAKRQAGLGAPINPEVLEFRRAEIDRRANNERRKGLIERTQIEQQAIVDESAILTRRNDQAQQFATQLLDIEAATTMSIDGALRRRTEIQESSTKEAIRIATEETEKRRSSLVFAIAQAPKGSEDRRSLERELTDVTEAGARRVEEIQRDSQVRQAQIAEQGRQSRLAAAATVFQIEATLGTAAADAEVKRWSAVARAAVDGSQVQVEALGKVAAAQRALQQSGQALMAQATSAFEAERARVGVTGDMQFVTRSAMQEATRRRLARDAETQARYEAGGPVLLGDFKQAQASGALKEGLAAFGGDLSNAFRAATQPVKDAFEESIGAPLAAKLREMTDGFMVGFTELTTGVAGAFATMEASVGGSVDRMLDRVRSGASEVVVSIADQVEEMLTRRLEAATRAQ